MLARLTRELGDYSESEKFSRESLAIARELGSKSSAGSALANLGWLSMIIGDYAASQDFIEESLALRQEGGDKFGVAASLTQRGYLAWHQGEFPAARDALRQGLALWREMEVTSVHTCQCLTGFAAVDVSEGRLARGASLLGLIAAESERIDRHPKDIYLRVYEQTLAAAQAQMDPEAFDEAWASGRALTMAQAMELAGQS
jgi:tetratricopeptide (TPR) repeat protein